MEISQEMMNQILKTYTEDKLSLKQVGAQFGVSPDTVKNVIVTMGGTVRNRGRQPGMKVTRKTPLVYPEASTATEDIEYTSEFDTNEQTSELVYREDW